MPETSRRRDASEPRRRRGVWPWVLGIFAAILLVLAGGAVAAVALANEAFDVRDDLESAKSQLSTVPGLVSAGDEAGFDQVATSVLADTARADETVQGPLWEVATWIPGVGPNVAAVRATTRATHTLVRDALPPAFGVLSAIQPERIRFEGGGFNLEPFREVLASLPEMDAAFSAAQEQVSGIDRAQLLPIVDDAVGEVLEVIQQTAPMARTATEVLPTALKMLGEDGPRRYLVLFQNNAEVRATGGIAAASVFVDVDNGRMTLAGQEGSDTYSGQFGGQQYLELPAETLALYDEEFALYSQNYTRTPNFPTSARMFQAVAAQAGYAVDGVLSLDPVMLSRILAVTGPVNVEGIEITSENAVPVLLSETYLRFPGDQAPADAFFAATSAAVFQKLVSGGWDLLRMIEVFQEGVPDQRVYGWFTREDEEAVAQTLGIDGALASDNTETTEVGIFLNDSSVSKLEYYLESSIAISCDPSSRTVTTAVTMTNTVDRDDLTFHILARRSPTYGGSGTTMMLDVLYFAPPGSTVASADPPQGDVPSLARASTEDGRAAQSVTVLVDRGQTRTVAFTSVLPEGELGPLSLRHTPTVTDTPVSIAPECAALTGD